MRVVNMITTYNEKFVLLQEELVLSVHTYVNFCWKKIFRLLVLII